MAYTTPTAVQRLLGVNYDTRRSPDLQQFVDSAHTVMGRLIPAAAQRGFTHTAAELEIVERWLSAYFYCKMDPLLASKTTEAASAQFVTSQSLNGEQERYKRGAIELDASGCLNALLNRQAASGFWLGKNPSAQIPYEDRR